MSEQTTIKEAPRGGLAIEDRFENRLRLAGDALRDCVEINPHKLGGIPVLRGTRFPVSQLLSHLADGDSVADVAENFDLDQEQLTTLLHVLSAYLDRPLSPA